MRHLGPKHGAPCRGEGWGSGEREGERERERDKRLYARPGLHPQHKQRVEEGYGMDRGGGQVTFRGGGEEGKDRGLDLLEVVEDEDRESEGGEGALEEGGERLSCFGFGFHSSVWVLTCRV